ncbi:MAG: hypothetical protein MJ101_03810 [Clostridia bacterium]|nr:hypothetical protein [Clostridia bacterium]
MRKSGFLTAVGTAMCVIPPLVATLCQFPVWVNSTAATVSGVALLCIFFSCLPFLKQLREYFKSPSAIVVWIVVFVLIMVMRSRIDHGLIVSAAGLIGDCLGGILFAAARAVKREDGMTDVDTSA